MPTPYVVTTGASVKSAASVVTTVTVADDQGNALFVDKVSYDGSADGLAAAVKQRIARYEHEQFVAGEAVVAAGVAVDLSVGTIDPARAAFNAAMWSELRQLTLAKLSPETLKLYDPAWLDDVPVGG